MESILTYLEAPTWPLFLVLTVKKLAYDPILFTLKACAAPTISSMEPRVPPKNETDRAQLRFF